MNSSIPKTRKIANIKNRKIDTETRLSGRSTRDTYRTRTVNLVLKGNEIQKISGRNMLADVVPGQEEKDAASYPSTIKIHTCH